MPEIIEYPKQLYRSGREDLSDSVVVNDAAEEEAARAEGFKMLDEEDESNVDLSLDGPAKPIIDAINAGVFSKDELNDLAEKEALGKKRKGVLDAIAAKVAE